MTSTATRHLRTAAVQEPAVLAVSEDLISPDRIWEIFSETFSEISSAAEDGPGRANNGPYEGRKPAGGDPYYLPGGSFWLREGAGSELEGSLQEL